MSTPIERIMRAPFRAQERDWPVATARRLYPKLIGSLERTKGKNHGDLAAPILNYASALLRLPKKRRKARALEAQGLVKARQGDGVRVLAGDGRGAASRAMFQTIRLTFSERGSCRAHAWTSLTTWSVRPALACRYSFN